MLENIKENPSLVLFPQELLRSCCEPLTIPLPDLSEFLSGMYSLMIKYNGVGLAAPQAGLSLRFFIMREAPHRPFRTFFNPRILTFSKQSQLGEEGCLSLPGIYAQVSRAYEIELEYFTHIGEARKETFTDLQARIIQHEVDHLDGILFVDHLAPPLKRKLLKKYFNSLKGLKVEK